MRLQRLKRHLLLVLSVWAAFSASAQRESVAMTVGDVSVSRSELLAAYRKNYPDGSISKKQLRDFAQRFADYLLQVQETKRRQAQNGADMGMQAAQGKASPLVSSVAVSNAALEQQAHLIYNKERERAAADGGVVKVAHIFLKLPQNASKAQEKRVAARADSIYRALQSGADFAQMAQRCSQDVYSAQKGGVLPWIAKGQSLKEFETVVFALRKGEMSQPFLSIDGYHIVQLKDKQPFVPYEEVRQALLRSLSMEEVRREMAQGNTPSVAVAPTSQEVMPATVSATPKVPDAAALPVWNDDMLLLTYYNEVLWRDAEKDKAALQRYFKEHRKQYRWDEPRIVNGKKQKAPEAWNEVADEVLADYRAYLVELQVERLRKQYPVMIYKKVLSTIQ